MPHNINMLFEPHQREKLISSECSKSSLPSSEGQYGNLVISSYIFATEPATNIWNIYDGDFEWHSEFFRGWWSNKHSENVITPYLHEVIKQAATSKQTLQLNHKSCLSLTLTALFHWWLNVSGDHTHTVWFLYDYCSWTSGGSVWGKGSLTVSLRRLLSSVGCASLVHPLSTQVSWNSQYMTQSAPSGHKILMERLQVWIWVHSFFDWSFF